MHSLRPAALLFSVAFLLLLACGGEDGGGHEGHEGHGEHAGAEGTHETRGTIRAIAEDRSQVTIEHEEVPGVMRAMTMPFQVDDDALLEGASVGDEVDFAFAEDGGRYVLRRLEAR